MEYSYFWGMTHIDFFNLIDLNNFTEYQQRQKCGQRLQCSQSFNHWYLFTLLCKMTWLKKIKEVRESPIQLLLPPIDPLFCPLLNLTFLRLMQLLVFFYMTIDQKEVLLTHHNLDFLSSKDFTEICLGSLRDHSIREEDAIYTSSFLHYLVWACWWSRGTVSKLILTLTLTCQILMLDAHVALILYKSCKLYK